MVDDRPAAKRRLEPDLSAVGPSYHSSEPEWGPEGAGLGVPVGVITAGRMGGREEAPEASSSQDTNLY